MMKKISWRNVQVWDGEGNLADEERRIQCLREYKTSGEISQHYLADTAATRDDDRVWDDYHEEYRDAWDAGPEVNEINWRGFPKEGV